MRNTHKYPMTFMKRKEKMPRLSCETESRRKKAKKKVQNADKVRQGQASIAREQSKDEGGQSHSKGMHEKQHTSVLFGLPSVTLLTACRAALLLQTQWGSGLTVLYGQARGGLGQASIRQEETSWQEICVMLFPGQVIGQPGGSGEVWWRSGSQTGA